MERLTVRKEDGYVYIKGTPVSDLCLATYCVNARICSKVESRECPYLKLIDRLAAYEDTGLEPEEIQAQRGISTEEKLPVPGVDNDE